MPKLLLLILPPLLLLSFEFILHILLLSSLWVVVKATILLSLSPPLLIIHLFLPHLLFEVLLLSLYPFVAGILLREKVLP